MAQRLTCSKCHIYGTKYNQTRVLKTPGGRLIHQTAKKRASGPKCLVTSKNIHGIPDLRSADYKRSRLSRKMRTVNKSYRGVLSGSAVRDRIIRAFLVEEQKIVKKVLQIQKSKEKQTAVHDRIIRAFLVEEQKIVKKVLKIQVQGKTDCQELGL